MLAASSTGHVQNPPRTVNAATLDVSGAARLHIGRRPHPRRLQTIERLTMTISDPDEWTCEGQADLLDELETQT